MGNDVDRIDSDKSAELNLLLACMRVQAGNLPLSAVPEYLSHVDTNLLLQLAMRNRLIPILFHVFEQMDGQVPEQMFSHVREAYLQSAARSVSWLAELERIHHLLDVENIPVIAMRGPILSWRLYGNPDMRQFSDLDLLIQPEQIQRATVLLEHEGYEAQFCLNETQQRAYIHFREERFFIRSAQRLCVDLHWRLLPRYFACYRNESDLWTRVERLDIKGYEYPVLNESDLILFLCAHGAKHGWDQLGLILDLGRALRGKSDEQLKVWHAAARNEGKGRIVELGYALVRDIMGLPIPVELCEGKGVAELVNQVKRGYSGMASRWGRKITRGALRSLDRARYLAGLVWTPSGIELEWMSLPRPLYFIYYLLRGVRLAVKHTVGRINHSSC